MFMRMLVCMRFLVGMITFILGSMRMLMSRVLVVVVVCVPVFVAVGMLMRVLVFIFLSHVPSPRSRLSVF